MERHWVETFSAAIAPKVISRHGAAFPCRVSNIVNDSRKVRPGGIFVAVRGAVQDGHDYIDRAIDGGAKVILHSLELKEYRPDICYWRLEQPFYAYAAGCYEAAGHPEKTLSLFGVTGTNGKTTTVYLWRHLLDCGMISTVECFDGKRHVPSSHTTPEPGVLAELFSSMRDNALTAAAMELSSHALEQGRCAGLQYRAAVFTNLTGDHLDYHHDMEHYYAAKKHLFTELCAPGAAAVVNIDDAYGLRLAREIKDLNLRLCTFGCAEEAQHRLRLIRTGADGSAFELGPERYDSNLIGMHNLYNLSGAILALRSCGVPAERIQAKLARPIRIPGRLDGVVLPNGARAFVDYAHTDDALRNVLRILRQLCQGRLIVVFGAGGDRDRTKRPRMGRAVAEGADFAVVTSDNPRSEDPEAIIAEIAAGIPPSFAYCKEVDRAKAIALAVKTAEPRDIVLVAGKGHETTQECAGEKQHFDDREELMRHN